MDALNVCIDTREPWPHPWVKHLPPEVVLTRAKLETGDFALLGAEDGAVIERKTVQDFLAAVGRERERFTKELLRARYVQSFAIVVEGTLAQVIAQAREVHAAAILGTIAAWTRRGFPVVFAGDITLAADIAFRFIIQPLNEARRLVGAAEKACPIEHAAT